MDLPSTTADTDPFSGSRGLPFGQVAATYGNRKHEIPWEDVMVKTKDVSHLVGQREFGRTNRHGYRRGFAETSNESAALARSPSNRPNEDDGDLIGAHRPDPGGSDEFLDALARAGLVSWNVAVVHKDRTSFSPGVNHDSRPAPRAASLPQLRLHVLGRPAWERA